MNLSYGDFIRNERVKRNLSQTDLAELTAAPGKTCISRNTINNIERGCNTPNPSTRRRLEAALESVKVSTFYDSSK